MTDNIFLLMFLIFDVFILGVLAAVAARHAYSHFKPERRAPPPRTQIQYLTHTAKERLIHDAQAQFQAVVRHAAAGLEGDLGSSAEQINQLIKKFATDIVEQEMRNYREELARLRARADAEMGNLRQEMAKHEVELKAKMQAELQAEKQMLIQQIDTKLADAMASFLTEALQHNIDLGNQADYLVSLLEENKAEFVKEVGNETTATK